MITIEQSFVWENNTFSELCSSRKYPYPTPHPPSHGGQKFQGEGGGVQKEVIPEELVGCLPLFTKVFSELLKLK